MPDKSKALKERLRTWHELVKENKRLTKDHQRSVAEFQKLLEENKKLKSKRPRK